MSLRLHCWKAKCPSGFWLQSSLLYGNLANSTPFVKLPTGCLLPAGFLKAVERQETKQFCYFFINFSKSSSKEATANPFVSKEERSK